MGLSRVAKVWALLCAEFAIDKLASKKVFSISGTNGKGSTCQMLSLLLVADNTKVGVYTSPHIHQFSERVQINHLPADEGLLVKAFEAIERARGKISLSYFEATTLVSLLIFAWEKVDYAILEVGLGGRLDAINIIDADAAILTSVGLDHQDFLGDDLENIALEKAGIFRANKPAVYAHTHIYDKVLDSSKSQKVSLIVNGKDYQQKDNRVYFKSSIYEIPNNLFDLGQHQLQNASAVIVLLAYLDLLPADYHSRLQKFSLRGRLQLLQSSPDIIVDVAHNEAAARALADYIRKQPRKGKYYALIGMLKDKDHAAVLSVFTDVFDIVFFASTQGDRGYSSEDLQLLWKKMSAIPSVACLDFQQALKIIKKQSNFDDTIYAFGSFLVATALTKNNT